MLYASVGGGKEIKMVGVFVKFEILFVLKKIVEEIFIRTRSGYVTRGSVVV